MSKLDKAKEKIITLRFWLGIVVDTLLAIVGWSIKKKKKIGLFLLIISFVVVLVLVVVVVLLSRYINTKINELEEL